MCEELEGNRGTISKDEINVLPMLTYKGDIRVVETESELLEALQLLRNETILGFDTEAKPSFKKGKLHPTSLVQLAGSQVVVLIRLLKVPLGELLASILSCSNIIKAGVAVHEDIRLLRKLYAFEPAGIVDLAEMAQCLQLKAQGLRTLAANLLGGRISKTVQCSNWEKSELSQQQIRYAATDAWVGREIYFKLLEMGAQAYTNS